MNVEILQRAQEMISNGYNFGQIEYGMTWEDLMKEGPYSDVYEAAEKLSEEFSISVELSLKYLKKAFNEYEPMDDDEEESEIQRIDENVIRKIVSESLKDLLKEGMRVGEFDYPSDVTTHYKPLRLSRDEFKKADSYFHIIGNKSFMFNMKSSGDVDLYAMNGENLRQVANFLEK